MRKLQLKKYLKPNKNFTEIQRQYYHVYAYSSEIKSVTYTHCLTDAFY